MAAMPIHISKQHGKCLMPTDSLNGWQIDIGFNQSRRVVCGVILAGSSPALTADLVNAPATSKRTFNISR
jgi:hypothetical protein